MQTKRLGKSDLEITPLGFGAWAIGGGGWAYAWGPQDDEASVAAIRRAVGLGVNWIDTAAVYGTGHSEEVVARALADVPVSERPYVFTKCSLVWNERREISHCLKRNSLLGEVEASLRRLRVDAIDLYQIHWPSFPPGAFAPDLEEAWETLADVRRQGKVRHLGLSNCDAGHMARVRPIAPLVSLQPPYSMLMRGVEDQVLPWCQAHQVGVIAYSPMQSGLLSGSMTRERIAAMPDDDWRPTKNAEFQEPRLSANLALVERLRGIGARHGRSPGEVAIAWTLDHPAVTGAIVGARSAEQVDGVIGAMAFRLTGSEMAEIEAALAVRAQAVHAGR